MKNKDIIVNLIIDHGLVEFRFSNKTDGDGHELESHQKGKCMT
jgi:hypothetical protein